MTGYEGSVQQAHDRDFHHQQMRMHYFDVENRRRGDGGAGGDMDFGFILMLLVPVVVVYLFVFALTQGITAVANESFFAPLFPRRGDSVVRAVLSVLTLVALLPGGLVLAARGLRGRRLHILRRAVLFPLAIVLVPAIVFMSISTLSAGAVRLAS